MYTSGSLASFSIHRAAVLTFHRPVLRQQTQTVAFVCTSFCSVVSVCSLPSPVHLRPRPLSLSPSLSSSRELWYGGFGRLRYAAPARHGIRRSELLNFTCEISPGSFFHNLGHIPQIMRCLKLSLFCFWTSEQPVLSSVLGCVTHPYIYIYIRLV